MCFGVRDALRATHTAAVSQPVTILGQLVHNPEVDRHLQTLGVQKANLRQEAPAPTQHVVITAHGASDRDREAWAARGHSITDTTCPLVRKAHDALRVLVADGYHPVVIGQANHVEVLGLTGDFPNASVVLTEADLDQLPEGVRLGVISQTTQPLVNVLALVDAMKVARPQAEVRFVDTVCHPTKQRQTALAELCAKCDLVIVVGGRNSNNTRQLVETARASGVAAHQVETSADLDPTWFLGAENVGITAGTSTLDETVKAVQTAIQQMAAT
jgi:4-hydroxy-3-methylbut-2-enyl diphosphate reductase